MCLHAVQRIIAERRYSELAIPEAAIAAIERSWKTQSQMSLYGRFDFSWDGRGSPKLLEYNADTPTSLLEAAIVQWYWLQDVLPGWDQFNSLHEQLIRRWKKLARNVKRPLYFAHLDDDEDLMTISYLRDTAEQAGIPTQAIQIEDIGWHREKQAFVDLEGSMIESIFKLYPWEGLLRDEFAPQALATFERVQWLEPAWKMLLSNKGILPILWEMYPEHPCLLEAHRDTPRYLIHYAKKPLLGREGANVTLVTQHGRFETGGEYGAEGFICQALAPLADFGGHYPVFGCWMIGGRACGMGIRESSSPITGNLSRFVPHAFAPDFYGHPLQWLKHKIQIALQGKHRQG
jgi:glutathionylspermidine synthase